MSLYNPMYCRNGPTAEIVLWNRYSACYPTNTSLLRRQNYCTL